MGDFAWAFMEPEEGKYQFDWLEKNVALAAQNGMKVILCTPTAAPPVWLSRKHPGDADGGRRGTPHESRRAAAGRLELAGVSRVRGEDRHRTRQALRARQARVGLAARQRTQPLREAVLLLAGRHAAVPRLAAREIRQHRPAEHRLGHGLLVDGVPEFRPDRDSQPTGAPGPAESARATGFRPLVRQGGGRLPAHAGRAAAPVRRGSMDHHQLHGDARRYRPDAFQQGSGRLHLDALPGAWRRFPGERAARLPPGERRGAELHARFYAAHQRHLRADGVAAGAGQLGRDQPVAAAGRDPHVDSARVRRGRADGGHLPLPAAADRQRTVSQGAGGDRRRDPVAGRPGVCRGHARRGQPARQISRGRQGAGRVRQAPHRVPDQLRQSLGHRYPQADHAVGYGGALDEILPRAEEHDGAGGRGDRKIAT